jgi:hypothetical protein
VKIATQLGNLWVRCGLCFESVKRRLGPLRRLATPLNGLLTGIIAGLIVYISFQIVPLYIKNYELAEAARAAAHLAAINFKSNEAVRDEIYEKAQELGLPVEIDQIKVESRVTQTTTGSIASLMETEPASDPDKKALLNIEISYVVPVEFPGYTFRLNFHLHADDRSV